MYPITKTSLLKLAKNADWEGYNAHTTKQKDVA